MWLGVGKFQDQHLVLMMKVRECLDYDLMKWFGFVGCEVMKEFELLEPSLLGLTCSFLQQGFGFGFVYLLGECNVKRGWD